MAGNQLFRLTEKLTTNVNLWQLFSGPMDQRWAPRNYKKCIRNKSISTIVVTVWRKNFINSRILIEVKRAYQMSSGSLWELHPKLIAVQENALWWTALFSFIQSPVPYPSPSFVGQSLQPVRTENEAAKQITWRHSWTRFAGKQLTKACTITWVNAEEYGQNFIHFPRQIQTWGPNECLHLGQRNQRDLIVL